MPKAIAFQAGDRMPNTRLCFREELPRTNPKERRARFDCDCGGSVDASISWVRHLNTTSCGCVRSELVASKNTKHSHATRGNLSGTYRSWQAMHQRVQSDPHYVNISVCARWTGDAGFANFLSDMGERPDDQTIERLDGNKDYEPLNCVWATRSTQAQNLAHTVLITLNGATRSINEWCRVIGIPYSTVKERRRRGMTTEHALTVPLDKTKQGRKQ